ncbi:Epidermal growth factor receptor substrate 15 homolog [Durusdinium trenchii]|uniref:Epidermal growth factor receptor substrate 15 homolog n=1 Tax=Durusdinium trenchii TaxID=1381693 RepID=A0ABP0Q1D2_9DINO
MQPAPQSANGIQYGPQEFEFYQQLFVIANPDGREALDPHVAANFLAASQLPQEILHQVWHFATSLQSYTQDYLMAEGFWLACRLVAWAQNGGLPLDVVHAHQEPPLLPEFPGLQRPPSSLGSRAHSIHGSEHSEMQPVIRLQHAAAVAAAEVAEGRGLNPRRWAPSRRERRKYAGLFQRSDWDHDGFVQAGEAKALMERSGLEEGILRQIWDLADARTQDGQLDFVEFVCMVHLVSCVLRGCGPLGPQLAPQLQQALATLEPLEQLAQEREESRSRSRSASPAPPVAELVKTERLTEMPDFETAFQTDGAEHFGGDFPKDFAKDFAGDFGDGGFGDLGDFGAFGDPFGTMGGAPETDLGEDPFRTSGFEPFHPSFPENERTRPLQSVLEKDRHLAQQLRKEVDQLDKDLRLDLHGQVSCFPLSKNDSKEIEKLRHHSQALQRDLEEGQRRLSELREARSVANQESLTLRRDQDHLLQELKFLRHMAEEEEELIILLQNSNQYLETSCGNLETNSQDLQRQISTEQEQLDREKKELRDFQGQLDNLKSSGLSSGTPVAEPPAAPKKKPTMILEREGV